VAAQSRYRKIAHSTASHNGVIASGPGPDVATPPAHPTHQPDATARLGQPARPAGTAA